MKERMVDICVRCHEWHIGAFRRGGGKVPCPQCGGFMDRMSQNRFWLTVKTMAEQHDAKETR